MQIDLDVSQLPPPEPMERILDTLDGLEPGDWLRVLLPREPRPLYPILENLGYLWASGSVELGSFELFIWPEDQAAPPGAN